MLKSADQIEVWWVRQGGRERLTKPDINNENPSWGLAYCEEVCGLEKGPQKFGENAPHSEKKLHGLLHQESEREGWEGGILYYVLAQGQDANGFHMGKNEIIRIGGKNEGRPTSGLGLETD